MRVSERHAPVLVPEQSLKAAGRHPTHRLVAGKRVAKIVKVEVLDAGALHSATKGAANGVMVLEREQPPVDARRERLQSLEGGVVQVNGPRLAVFGLAERGDTIRPVD